MATTLYTMNDVYVQVIQPAAFSIKQVKTTKKNINITNYANAGFQANGGEKGVIPVANLVIDGKIITNTKDQATWLNTCKHNVSTIGVDKNNKPMYACCSTKEELSKFKYAVSGVPIIIDGWGQKMTTIKKEGWDGTECYDTWHGFLGIRGNKLVYVAAKCGFGSMVYLLDSLGITHGIKLDGGGSFIAHSMDLTVATPENRKIDNIIVWQ